MFELTEKEIQALKANPLTRELQIEAAMCAWEHVVEKYNDFEEFGGACEARHNVGQLGSAIHTGWTIANIDYQCNGHAYDWEFVPWFIDNCTAGSNFELAPDWLEKCRRPSFLPSPKIKPSPMFATPESRDALVAHGEAYHGEAKAAFTMGMMLTWNYLAAQL